MRNFCISGWKLERLWKETLSNLNGVMERVKGELRSLKDTDDTLQTLNFPHQTFKRVTTLNKDKAALEKRLAKTDFILSEIGGKLTEEEARRLILEKLYDLAHSELNRYLNTEKRKLIQAVENLWDKYAVSSCELENTRTNTLESLNGFLIKLRYLR